MTLIEEIEEAANAYSRANDSSAGETGYAIVVSPWWPRIREALLAAQEMADSFDGRYADDNEFQMLKRFRAAFSPAEGKE